MPKQAPNFRLPDFEVRLTTEFLPPGYNNPLLKIAPNLHSTPSYFLLQTS